MVELTVALQGAYSKWATTLIEKGYKVARIEQTETPAQLEERNKAKSGPKDKVVAREVCQLSTKGTRVNTFLDAHNFEGEPSYLLAICERPGPEVGVAFVDTTLGCFHLGQIVGAVQLCHPGPIVRQQVRDGAPTSATNHGAVSS